MMKTLTLSLLFSVLILSKLIAQPTFLDGEAPDTEGKCWVAVDRLSDEFEGNSLDHNKWQDEPIGNGWMWDGRPPALFRPENVTLKDGKMRVTVGKLPEVYKNASGRVFTHQGAIVRSLYPGQVGWYYECKMKANATEMSSTFWLMTKGNTKKKLELDIQECVGKLSPNAEPWSKGWDQIFHSNTIHRLNKYNQERVQLQQQVTPATKNHERFYVYGCWWKSPKEIQFFLDGKYVYSIVPNVDWDVPAYIQMAIETYSWNPLPEDGGMVESGTLDQRTTQYEWVRTWRLE